MKLKIVTVLICLNCYSLFAKEPLNTIGIAFGLGQTNHTFKDNMGDEILIDNVFGSTKISYNYLFSENWAFDSNYLTADSTRASILFDDLVSRKLSLNEVSLGIKGILKASEHNDFFVRLNASSYSYKIKKKSFKLLDEKGIGAIIGIGWQYHFDNGLQLNISYDYHRLGKVNYYFGNYGIAYRF